MSARNEMAAMLDQLMGPRRNADTGCNALVRFDDPEVCPLALVAYCPHDAFNNTKYELQPCKKIHEPKLREDYEKSSRRYKLGYEQEALAYFLGLQRDLHRRIDANKAKLKLERGDGALDEAREALRNKLSCVETEIESTQAAAEKAGAAGDIEKSVALVQQAEAMQAQRDDLRRQMDVAASQPRTFKAMEVCEVCGCLLIVNDAACRVEDHLTGKVHTGYIHIDQAVKQLKMETPVAAPVLACELTAKPEPAVNNNTIASLAALSVGAGRAEAGQEDSCPHLLAEVRAMFEVLKTTEDFNRVAAQCVPVSASKTRLVVEMVVEKCHVNSKGTLHGGQTATLVDCVTARLLGLTVKNCPMASVEIATSYMNPCLLGDVLVITAEVLKSGRNIAFTECEFRRKSDGRIVAKGKHTIAMLPVPKDHVGLIPQF